MPEERRAPGNVTRKGRYGSAPEDQPHMEPEVKPVTMESADVRPQKPIAGALPENEGEEGQ